MPHTLRTERTVWRCYRLGLGAGHAGLELAHGEVLPGLGRYHRVLDVLEVVGLDRPVRSRAGGDALFDDLGNATSRRDGHHLPPMRQERLPLTRDGILLSTDFLLPTPCFESAETVGAVRV